MLIISPPPPQPSIKTRACALCGWSVWVWLGSVLSIFFVALVYNNMLSFSPAFFGVASATYSLPSVWLQILLVPTACVALDVLYYFVADEFFPSPVQAGIEDAWLVQPALAAAHTNAAAAATATNDEEVRIEMGALQKGGVAASSGALASVVPAN